jgi:hypothetical protein
METLQISPKLEKFQTDFDAKLAKINNPNLLTWHKLTRDLNLDPDDYFKARLYALKMILQKPNLNLETRDAIIKKILTFGVEDGTTLRPEAIEAILSNRSIDVYEKIELTIDLSQQSMDPKILSLIKSYQEQCFAQALSEFESNVEIDKKTRMNCLLYLGQKLGGNFIQRSCDLILKNIDVLDIHDLVNFLKVLHKNKQEERCKQVLGKYLEKYNIDELITNRENLAYLLDLLYQNNHRAGCERILHDLMKKRIEQSLDLLSLLSNNGLIDIVFLEYNRIFPELEIDQKRFLIKHLSTIGMKTGGYVGEKIFEFISKNEEFISSFADRNHIQALSKIAAHKITNPVVYSTHETLEQDIAKASLNVTYIFFYDEIHRIPMRIKKDEAGKTEVVILDSTPILDSLPILFSYLFSSSIKIYYNNKSIQKGAFGCDIFTYKIIRYLEKQEFREELDNLIAQLPVGQKGFDITQLSFAKIIAELKRVPEELEDIDKITLGHIEKYKILKDQELLSLQGDCGKSDTIPQKFKLMVQKAISEKYLAPTESPVLSYKDSKDQGVLIADKRGNLDENNSNIIKKNKKLFLRSYFLAYYEQELRRAQKDEAKKTEIVGKIRKKLEDPLFKKEAQKLLESLSR